MDIILKDIFTAYFPIHILFMYKILFCARLKVYAIKIIHQTIKNGCRIVSQIYMEKSDYDFHKAENGELHSAI